MFINGGLDKLVVGVMDKDATIKLEDILAQHQKLS